MGCPYLHKPQACASRQKWTTPAPSDCRACDLRERKAISDDTNPPSDDTKRPIPATIRPKPETITTPKEAPVSNKMTPKERCLALLTRNGSASPSLMMQRCHIASEDLKAIVASGEIKSWPYRGARQRMTALYTLPDAKDPRTKEMLEAKPPEKKAAPSNDATVVSKKPPRVNRPAARATAEPVVRNRKPTPSDGSGPYAAVIADLEMRRDAINHAIEGLRALA